MKKAVPVIVIIYVLVWLFLLYALLDSGMRLATTDLLGPLLFLGVLGALVGIAYGASKLYHYFRANDLEH